MADKSIVSNSKLAALANAIRTKGGTSAQLTVDEMAQAVADIPTGSSPKLTTGKATPTTEDLTYVAGPGWDGFSSFLVKAIPNEYVVPEGSVSITENGTYDVSGKAEAVVNVPSSGDSGIEIVTDSSGKITYYDCRMSEIPEYLFNYTGYNRSSVSGFPTIRFPVKPTKIGAFALNAVYARIDWSGLTEVEEVGTGAALRPAYSANLDGSNDVVNLAKFVGFTSANSAIDIFRTNSAYAPKTYILPLCVNIPQYAWYGYTVKNVDITIGSIGHGVVACRQQPFGGTSSATGTVTVYTTGDILDTLRTTIQQNAGSGLTFVYKASEATTYNGTSYAAGDTILTSEVA